MVLGIRGMRRCGGFIYLLLPGDAAQLRILPCALRPSPTLEVRISANPELQIFALLLPQEMVCPVWRQPLSRVSGRKRYNTLDFAEQGRVPTGCYSPLLETLSQGDIPLRTPHFSSLVSTQTVKIQFVADAKKMQKESSAHELQKRKSSFWC